MKNKLIAITLSVACVLASCIPTALANFNHVETTSVDLEEVSDQPTWNVIKKNDDIQQIYQETYDRVYQETLNNLAQQQAETQANVENTMNQLKNSDIMKWFQANNEKVVKDIDYDKNGNLVVKYSNGTQKSLTNKVASTPVVTPTLTHDYEQVGYILPCDFDVPFSLELNHVLSHYQLDIEQLKVSLVEITNIPSQKYHYKIESTYSITVLGSNSMWDRKTLCLDNTQINSLNFPYYGENIQNESLGYDYYSSIPLIRITGLGDYR